MRNKLLFLQTSFLLVCCCVFLYATPNQKTELFRKFQPQLNHKIKVFQKTPFLIPEEYKKNIPSDYRRKWYRMTGFEFSGLHWNQFIVVYVNQKPEVYENNYSEYIRLFMEEDNDAEGSFQEYPQGTIVLKEQFSVKDEKPGEPLTLTIMEKRHKGYDPKTGDWRFSYSSKSGRMLLDGNSSNQILKKMCIECHSNMKERDFVFSTYFNNNLKMGL